MKKLRNAIQIIKQIKNWPLFFRDYFGFAGAGIVMYKARNSSVYVARAGTTDRGIINAVAIQDEYHIKELGRLGTVIDLGGNIASFAITAAAYADRVIMVEPIKENLELANRAIAQSGLEDKIIVVPSAIGEQEGTVRIYLSHNNTGGHSSVYPSERFEDCPVVTLPSLFGAHSIERCDLLKIDIEGGEYDVIYSLPDPLWNKIRRIHLEWHDLDTAKKNHQELIAFLESKGYSITTEPPILFAVR